MLNKSGVMVFDEALSMWNSLMLMIRIDDFCNKSKTAQKAKLL